MSSSLLRSALGIRAKVGLLVGGLVVLTGGLIGFLGYRQTADALLEAGLEEVDAFARTSAVCLGEEVDEKGQDALLLASLPHVSELVAAARRGRGDPETAALRRAFRDLGGALMGENPEEIQIGLFDPVADSWLARIRRGADGGLLPGRWPGPAGPEDRALSGLDPGRPVTLLPFAAGGPGRAQAPMIRAAAPVEVADDPVPAWLVVRIDLKVLYQMVGDQLPRGYDLILADAAGRFLADPKISERLGFLDGGDTLPFLMAPDRLPVTPRSERTGYAVLRPDARGGRVAAAVRRVPLVAAAGASSLRLGVVRGAEAILVGLAEARLQSAFFTLILVGISLLLGWRLASSLAGPLDQIAAAVAEFGRGEPLPPLPEDAPGEAGLLARAIAGMVDQVEERTAQLEEEVASHRRTATSLTLSERRFRSFYHDSPAMFLTTDAGGRLVAANRFAGERLGRSVEELVGRGLLELAAGEAREALAEHLRVAAAEPERRHECEVRLLRGDGAPIWVRFITRRLPGEGETLILWVGEDVTLAHELSEDLDFRDHHDALTGLPNRREVERRLQVLIEHAVEKGSRHALVLLDLDQFKVICDTCGHPAGDELLRQVARVIEAHVDPPDLLARLGGDEFALLLKDCPVHHALARLEGIRAALRSLPFAWQGRRFSVTASAGLVEIEGAGQSVATVMSLADTLCFAAKDAGRDRVQVYQEGDAQLAAFREQMEAVSMITQAFEEDRFRLYRQPIVPVADREEGDHYEILIRMVGADGRVLPPGVFLQSAERFNLSGRIDRWVVATAIDWLKKNPRELERLSLCSLNLSGLSIGDAGLLEFIDHLLADGVVPPEKICFEVTETAAVADIGTAVSFIRRLRDRGCRFALDDFGSGHSSFAYLRQLPVDFLKIDGMFVRDIAADPTALAMVKSIHEVGRVMGKRTIAEFVENDRILDQLRRIGVDFAQGYGLGAPRPIEEPLFGAAGRTEAGAA
ncbi:MAG: EAL domain-containing protein [Planctomycetota bacterium]|nr:MAG: EAL domain-containing protein [Planctomycetota bacterium]